jgi:Tfp pilus assembly protein PilO
MTLFFENYMNYYPWLALIGLILLGFAIYYSGAFTPKQPDILASKNEELTVRDELNEKREQFFKERISELDEEIYHLKERLSKLEEKDS